MLGISTETRCERMMMMLITMRDRASPVPDESQISSNGLHFGDSEVGVCGRKRTALEYSDAYSLPSAPCRHSSQVHSRVVQELHFLIIVAVLISGMTTASDGIEHEAVLKEQGYAQIYHPSSPFLFACRMRCQSAMVSQESSTDYKQHFRMTDDLKPNHEDASQHRHRRLGFARPFPGTIAILATRERLV